MLGAQIGDEKPVIRKAKAKAMATSYSSATCDDDELAINGSSSNAKRRRMSPAVLMEGSRCSRVNERGWRCCQQTLVGYSLCERHLGKGRLRSIRSVRGRKPIGGGINGENIVSAAMPLPAPPQKRDCGDDDDEEDYDGEVKSTNTSRKGIRKKIGIVKARLISSLLDDKNNPTPAANRMMMMDG